RAFDNFDPERIARYDEAKLTALLADPGIVRNRLKVKASVRNAQSFLAVRAEHGSFARYLWAWVDDTPIVNRPRTLADLPARTDLSDRLGKDPKKRASHFLGSTIVYSYMQAARLTHDH